MRTNQCNATYVGLIVDVQHLSPSTGLTAPRRSKTGGPLPPPRIVSFMLHQDVSDYDNEVTYLVIAWGQLLDHDLTFAALPKGNLCLQACVQTR